MKEVWEEVRALRGGVEVLSSFPPPPLPFPPPPFGVKDRGVA